MKKSVLFLAILLCFMPVSVSAMAFPIDFTMNGAERSYAFTINDGSAVYFVDMGFPSAMNEAVIPVETVSALLENGIHEIEYRLPWITGRLNLSALTIPERNEAVRISLQQIEPVGNMRVKWRAYRPGKLVDPFEIGVSAEFTPDVLPEGVAGIVYPDPDPPSGQAFGFIAPVRYNYTRERLRVLRWNGESFVDIPGARWEVIREGEITYIRAELLPPGVYTVIDAKAVDVI